MLSGYIGSLPAFITSDKKDIIYLYYSENIKKRVIINPDRLINDGCVMLSNGRFITCRNNIFTLLTPYVETDTVIYRNKVLDISHGTFRKFDGANDIKNYIIIRFQSKTIIYDVASDISTIISDTNIHTVRFVSNYIYQVITGHHMYLFDMKLNKKVFEDKFQDLQSCEYNALIDDYKAIKPICGTKYVLFPLPEIEIHDLNKNEHVFLDDSYALEGEIILFYKTYDDRYIRTRDIDEAQYLNVGKILWDMRSGKVLDKGFKYIKPTVKNKFICTLNETMRVDFKITEKDTEQYIVELNQFLHSILRNRIVSPIINKIGKFIIKEHISYDLIFGMEKTVNHLTDSILSVPEKMRNKLYGQFF